MSDEDNHDVLLRPWSGRSRGMTENQEKMEVQTPDLRKLAQGGGRGQGQEVCSSCRVPPKAVQSRAPRGSTCVARWQLV